ncbi:MAG: type II secretion system protein [Nitrosomonadales bacterium]
MKLKTGFTMIEMTIVLIMIGILTAALAPLLMSQHTNNLEERDRVALTNAKNAIISYATTFGGIPDPQNADASGNPVGSVVGLMPPVTGGLNPVPALGVNNWGVFGSNTTNQFQMDVNDSLKLSCINALATGSTSCTPSATAPTTAVASGGEQGIVLPRGKCSIVFSKYNILYNSRQYNIRAW